MTDVAQTSKYAALCSRLRQRLITIPRPGAQAFKPTYPISYTYTAGTVHKPGDSAGYVSFNPTMNACAAGYDPNNVMVIEHIFVIDPLMEEAAQALAALGNKPPENETCEQQPVAWRRYVDDPYEIRPRWLLTSVRPLIDASKWEPLYAPPDQKAETGTLLCRYCPARFMTAWEHEVHEKEHAQKASEGQS